MNQKHPTDAQQRYIDAILVFQYRHGYSPDLEEIATEVGVWKQAVINMLERLGKKGYIAITYKHGRIRKIDVAESGNPKRQGKPIAAGAGDTRKRDCDFTAPNQSA